MKRFIAAVFLLLTGAGLMAQKQNSLLWRIKSPEGQISHLFGTYHLLGSDYVHSHPLLKATFNESRVTVVETKIDSSQMFQVAMMAMMKNTTLPELMDSADYNKVKVLLEEIGLPPAAANRMKPIALTAAYSLKLANEHTPDNLNFEGVPIDAYFAISAEKQGQKLVTLETMQEQLEMLYNAQSLEDQAEDLLAMVEDKEHVGEVMAELLQAYLQQDLKAMLAISEEQEEVTGDMALLLDERNERWVKQLTPIIDEGQAFIAVGALHLAGEQGLVSLLTQEGYTLEPVAYSAKR